MVTIFAALLSITVCLSGATPKTLTPIGDTELIATLERSHVEAFGRKPSKTRVAMAWAQVSLENARGREVYNYNLGNVGPSRGQAYYRHGPTRFRSYTSFNESSRAYWKLLHERCSAALASFDAMNAAVTARRLRRCGYYRADVDRYAVGLNGLMWQGMRLTL